MATAQNIPFDEIPKNIGTADKVLDDVSGLISPPSVCIKLYQQVQSKNASAEDIGKTLENDPNLVARVLRIVNSAIYNFPSQITTISRAVTIIGTQDLCNLVMAIAAVRSLSKMNGGLFTIENYWKHSVYVGLSAKHLARHSKISNPDTFFIAGLLHDIGIPIIYGNRPELSAELKTIFDKSEHSLAEIERQRFGFDHAYIGGKLLKNWGLPELLIHSIANHHQPLEDLGSTILYIAESCSDIREKNLSGEDDSIEAICPNIEPSIWQSLRIDPTNFHITEILDIVDQEHSEVLRALTN